MTGTFLLNGRNTPPDEPGRPGAVVTSNPGPAFPEEVPPCALAWPGCQRKGSAALLRSGRRPPHLSFRPKRPPGRGAEESLQLQSEIASRPTFAWFCTCARSRPSDSGTVDRCRDRIRVLGIHRREFVGTRRRPTVIPFGNLPENSGELFRLLFEAEDPLAAARSVVDEEIATLEANEADVPTSSSTLWDQPRQNNGLT